MRLVALVALAGCTTEPDPVFLYRGDGAGVLCSELVDDYVHEPRWDEIARAFDAAAANGWVALMHGHEPEWTISDATLERLIEMADERELPLVTYRSLDAGPLHAGVALAFDDNQPVQWLHSRELFLAHGAQVTYFVTKWQDLTDEDKTALRVLAADGHDLQPHSVTHERPNTFVAKYGIEAYVTDEALPSFTPLAAEGYPGTTYAYPAGDRGRVLDEMMLAHVAHVRTGSAHCPGLSE